MPNQTLQDRKNRNLRTTSLIIASVLIVFFSLNSARAEEESSSSLGADLSIASRYVWRGLVFDKDPVLQPDVWVQVKGLSITFWGNMDLTDEDGEFQGQFNEWDTYVSVEVGSIGRFTYGAELDFLSFLSSSGQEGSGTAELCFWTFADYPISPALKVYWDIWQQHSLYANLGLAHGRDIGPGSLSISGSLGWGDDRHNLWSGLEDAGGLLDGQVQLGYSLPLKGNFSLNLSAAVSTLFQQDIRDYYESIDLESDNLFVILNLGYTK